MGSKDLQSALIRQGKRAFVWLVALSLLALAGALVFFSMPYTDSTGGVAAVEEDERVTVEQTDFGYALTPTDTDAEAGLVFYPGGRVAPDAYVGSLGAIPAETDVAVFVPEMGLSLAVVDYGLGQAGVRSHAADRVMEEYPDIEDWYVGGHSLGGAMACRYARQASATSESPSGLLLYGAYCDLSLAESDLDVLSVVGDADMVLDRDAYERNLANLPSGAQTRELQGVNHTQFGSYTGQDAPSGTSYRVAHERLNEVVIPWFENQTEP